MGEKGNVTSEELAAAAGGVGVLATGTTHVTAVLQDTGEKLRDALVDKGADAVIETSTERLRGAKEPGTDGNADGKADGDQPTP
jgi:hypothetical protein